MRRSRHAVCARDLFCDLEKLGKYICTRCERRWYSKEVVVARTARTVGGTPRRVFVKFHICISERTALGLV